MLVVFVGFGGGEKEYDSNKGLLTKKEEEGVLSCEG